MSDYERKNAVSHTMQQPSSAHSIEPSPEYELHRASSASTSASSETSFTWPWTLSGFPSRTMRAFAMSGLVHSRLTISSMAALLGAHTRIALLAPDAFSATFGWFSRRLWMAERMERIVLVFPIGFWTVLSPRYLPPLHAENSLPVPGGPCTKRNPFLSA